MRYNFSISGDRPTMLPNPSLDLIFSRSVRFSVFSFRWPDTNHNPVPPSGFGPRTGYDVFTSALLFLLTGCRQSGVNTLRLRQNVPRGTPCQFSCGLMTAGSGRPWPPFQPFQGGDGHSQASKSVRRAPEST